MGPNGSQFMSFQKTNGGFTIIELMIVVALVGIAAAYAVPTFTNVIANNQVRSTANNLVGVLNFSRSEALQRGSTVRVGPLDGASWVSGVAVWADGDGNTTFDPADTELRRIGSLPGSITLAGSAAAIGFRANGFLTPAAAAEFSISVCNSNLDEGRDVFVGFSGRIRTAVRNC